jgi:hypothetical protein
LEILSVHSTQIFGNFHLALPPIIGGPHLADLPVAEMLYCLSIA